MAIKELSLQDYERIIDLWNQSGMHARPKGRDRLDNLGRQMALGTVFILGDEEAGILRGVIIISHDGRKGWMNRLAVLPKYREKGIASNLIGESENRLRRIGIEIFAAHIEEENSSSRRLFEKLGYTPARDIIYYTKRLNDET